MAKIIYLDNAATTQTDSKVLGKMLPSFTKEYGNASSSHFFGKQARESIEKAREIIAKKLNSSPEEIIFTSGGTESNNLALKGLFFNSRNRELGKNHIITTKIEHDCILNTCKWLEKQGAKVTYLDVDNQGLVNPKEIVSAITPSTLVVSIIQGNNEIGTLQDIKEIGKICKKKGVYFHIDACQSFTKTPIDVKKHNLDLVTINAHKIHGPKGVGALFIKKGTKIEALLNGGGHERGLRSGTENTSGVIGFGEAVRISKTQDINKIQKLRDYFIKQLLKIEKTKINGSLKNRLANNINLSFGDIEGEAISSHLENFGIVISTGSACASHTLKKSHVLKAIGCNDLEINSSIRISLSKYNTKTHVDYFIKKLKPVVKTLRQMSPYATT
ncbi:cysteine desulfurase [Candidatus Pacearchaeota archaeon]|nr:cysteine desulfurase [Candidatus Pacearchaeota archaeon]